MTRRRSSPLGLELVVSVVLALVVLPLLSHGAPVQDAHADLQRYSEGCYYNYNHYSEGDRILTNEPCLNCTCHNKMLMCYLRVCPFTKPIGHDCTVEKREDQCCPIITCPEVPVDIAHQNHQLTTHGPGTELSIPEKYGCSIDRKFYPEGAQVPSNPNKPCELCYCIRNRTQCLMQECTLHIDGCQPIYNKGSCCPIKYNCDHENELLELEDYSTTTTTVRPTPGYVLSSTTSPLISTDCVHNNQVYADGASITGKNACEHCYCMRGDIVCAVQECEMPTLESGAKTCRALPPAAGECCPSNYVCEDDAVPTEPTLTEQTLLTTIAPKDQSILHESVSQEDVQLQEHIDDKEAATEVPEKIAEPTGSGDGTILEHSLETTIAPGVGELPEEVKKPEEEEKPDLESPIFTTVSPIKETSYETTSSTIELTTTHKTEEGLDESHIIIGHDKEYDSTQAPIKDEFIIEEEKEVEIARDVTTVAPESVPMKEEKKEEAVPSKEEGIPESTTISAESSEEEEVETEKAEEPSLESKPTEKEVVSVPEKHKPIVDFDATTIVPIKTVEEGEEKVTEAPSITGTSTEEELPSSTKVPTKADIPTEISVEEELTSSTIVPTKAEISPEVSGEEELPSSTKVPSEADISPEVSGEEELPSSTTIPSKADILPEISAEEEQPVSTGVPSISDILPETSSEEELPSSTEVPSKTHITPQEEETSSESAESSEETPVKGQDKIDHDIFEPSIVASTVSPVYEMVTQGEDSDIIMPEVGDHKAEAFDHEKKPKDESDIPPATAIPTVSVPDEIKKDELPQITVDSTTIRGADSGEEEISTLTPLPQTPVKPEAPTTEFIAPHEDKTELAPELPATSQPTAESVESEEISTEAEDLEHPDTSVPSVLVEETKPHEDVQKGEDEIPAAVQEITERPPKPISEAIPEGEEEITDQTTKLPTKDSGTEDVSDSDKSEEEEGEVQSTESSAIEEQKEFESATTVFPLGVHKAEEGESTVPPVKNIIISSEAPEEVHKEEEVKGQPEEGITESTTVAAAELPIAEEEAIKGHPEKAIPDSTTIAPSIAESQDKFQPELGITDFTTIAPSAIDSEVPSAEKEEVKPEQSLDVFAEGSGLPPLEDSTTIVPPSSGGEQPISVENIEEEGQKQSVPSIIDSTTIAPLTIDTKEPTTEEEVIKGLPEQAVADLTTTAPSIAESEETSSEEELKGQPEQTIAVTTIAPSLADSEIPTTQEEIVKKRPEEAIADSETIAPSSAESEESSTKADVEGKPELGITESTIITPSVAESEELSAEEEEVKGKPEHGVAESTTISPTVSESEKPSGEEEEVKEKPTHGISESTTIVPSVAESEEPSPEEEEVKGKPEHGVTDATTIAPSVPELEEPSAEEEEVKGKPEHGIADSTTIAPSVPESEEPSSEEEEVKGTPEQAVGDSTTITPSVPESEEPSAEEEELKEKPEHVADSTTTAPSVPESEEPSAEEEEVKGKPEHGVADATTIAPFAPDFEELSAEDEQVKGKPITDSSTIAPSVSESEEPSSEEEAIKGKPEHGVVDSTSISPSVAESEGPSTEEGKVEVQPEQGIADSTTIAPSIADTEAPSTGEEKEGEPDQGVVVSTTSGPSVADSELPSEEEGKREPEHVIADTVTTAPSAAGSEIPSSEEEEIEPSAEKEQEHIHRTTVPPLTASDEESSEVVEAPEGSGEQSQEIVPSAIPGEGDCLVNERTFVNNATVPTSNECELSCKCVSSIVVCQRVQCYEPPQPNNCVLDEASSDRCCPQYICGIDSFADGQQPATTEDIEDEEIQFTTLPPLKKYPEISAEPGIEEQGPLEPAATTVPTIVQSEEEATEEAELGSATRKPEDIKPVQEAIEPTIIPVKEDESLKTEKPTLSEEEPIIPIKEDEAIKTEKPTLFDETPTPSSLDIEVPIIRTEEPLSHVKDEETKEESTEEASAEDISTESQPIVEDKIQPLPSEISKPAQEITGDIEEPAQVTVVPDLGAPSKKPSAAEESTTLKAADEEEKESATVTPLISEISAGDDSVTIDTQTESGKPTLIQEEILTESPVGAPKIDESIFAPEVVIGSQPTTIKPIESEIASEAPSLSSVLDSEGVDSEQSEEASEIPEQSSSESGEETESEEDTKLPSLHEEVPTTTAGPVTLEQSTIKTVHTDLSGEIAPAADSTTIIPDADYQKPEIPEDLSHTKVEAELPLETVTKKPLEPVSAEESQESEEGKEGTEKPFDLIAPPKAPISTVLTPIEPTEKDHQQIDTLPAISDKKDEFPEAGTSVPEKEQPLDHSTEQVPIEQQKPLPPSIATATSEEEFLPGTVAPVSAVEPEVEKDEIPSQTGAPTIEEEPSVGTVVPVVPTEEHEIEEELPIAGTIAPVSGDEIIGTTIASADKKKPSEETSVPVLGDETEEKTDQPPRKEEPIEGTVAPLTEDEQTIAGTVAPISVDGLEVEKVEIAGQTIAPSSEEQPISGTIAPAIEPESEEEKEAIASQTSAPTIIDHPLSTAVSPSLETESDEEKEEIPSQTSVPIHGLDEDHALTSQTSASPTEHEAEVSSSTESSSEEEEQLITDTAKPAIDEDKRPSDQVPLKEEEKEAEITTLSTPVKDVEFEDEELAATESSVPVKAIKTGEEDLAATEVPVPVKAVETEGEILEGTTVTSPVKAVEAEEQDLASTEIPAISVPVKAVETEGEDLEGTTITTPVKAIEAGEHPTVVPGVSTHEKAEGEDLSSTEAPAASIPTKTAEKEDEELAATKGPEEIELATEAVLSSTPAPVSAVGKDEFMEETKAPISEESPEKESTTPAVASVSETEEEEEEEGSAETPSPVSADVSPSKADRGSEEEPETEPSTEESLSPAEGPISEDKQHIDKTLLQTESPLPAGETVRPLPVEEKPTEDELEEIAPQLPSAQTENPVLIGEISPETETPITSTDAAVIPELETIDVVTAQPSKPGSGDQISVDEVLPELVKPSADETPAQTESPVTDQAPEVKKPLLDESLAETEEPKPVEKLESDEILAQTEKPTVAVVSKDKEIPPIEGETSISAEEAATEQAVPQTEGPISVPSVPSEDEEISAQTSKPHEIPTEQSIASEEQAVPIIGDQQITKDTTGKPVEDASSTESEEEEEKEIPSTVAPVELAQTSAPSSSEAPIAPVDSESATPSSEESEEESEHTEVPKEDVKIQTIAEFVTERGDELTTKQPIQDIKKEEIPQEQVAIQPEETSTLSSEEEEEGEPQISITETVIAVPIQEESEEKPEAPETPSEIEKDQKQEEHPTESAIPASKPEKPLEPVEDKFETDLPKPIATDEVSSEEEEAPLPTTVHPLFPHIDLDRTTIAPAPLNASDRIADEVHVSESTVRPSYASSSTLAPKTEQPTTPQAITSAPTSHYQPPSYGHVPPQYPSYTEDEYTDEDETEVFGPGTCRYGGKLFVSAQQIPRDDPCDFCFCFRSDIICLQQSCPPPISGCHEEPISGFCCPRYECPVSMATVLNITTSTTTTSTTLPPHFLHHAYRGAAEKNGCHINGKSYRVGDKIDSASGPCMHCACGGDGQMKCDPKTCSPEPMLRQMIAVVASRRR